MADSEVATIFCRSCGVGFAVRGARPSFCPNESCLKPADWSLLNPTPRKPYALTVSDCTLLKKMRIAP